MGPVNTRELIRKELGEEAVKEFDEARKVQRTLEKQLLKIVADTMEAQGKDDRASKMMMMCILEGTATAYAQVVLAGWAALSDPENGDKQFDRSDGAARTQLVATAIKSVVAHLKENFDAYDAKQSGVADQIKAAAKSFAESKGAGA